VDAHLGRWGHGDWLVLLESLRRSPYWPLDPDAVGAVLEVARRRRRNLRRWEQSGAARAWVEAHPDGWGHGDWLALLEDLSRSPYGQLDPDAVGGVLEEIREEWRNLRRWEQSGAARRWVEARQGRWGGADWVALWEALRHSEFWPLDRDAAEKVLRRRTAEWWNLRSWQQSGQPGLWVEARQGRWGHDDWLALLEVLRRSPYWPLDPDAVGGVLEQVKREYGNLRRWEQSGAARAWVEARQGRWDHGDWVALVETLRGSEFWPMDTAAVEVALKEIRVGGENLHRWEQSGAARAWVEARQGRWDHGDWVGLLATLRRSGFWPLDTEALAGLLRRLNLEWWNLHRWRASGLARRWVEARQGRWGHGDWLALLESLRASGFWPADPASLSRVLEEVKAEWSNLRRWQRSGRPGLWVGARQGRWTARDWQSLLDSLRQSEFWPLDPDAVREVVDGTAPPARQAG
jgi:hypothetical protein